MKRLLAASRGTPPLLNDSHPGRRCPPEHIVDSDCVRYDEEGYVFCYDFDAILVPRSRPVKS